MSFGPELGASAFGGCDCSAMAVDGREATPPFSTQAKATDSWCASLGGPLATDEEEVDGEDGENKGGGAD